jgi:pyrrolidone-carboxylate peptidase
VNLVLVRVPTFEFSEQERRAIRYALKRRKTPCSRREARQFITAAVQSVLRDSALALGRAAGVPDTALAADPDD